MRQKRIDKEKGSAIRKIMLSVLMIAFFVCVVFVYYLMLYSQTRENIISNGRINAIESAEQIDKRLSASVDTLKLASYTLDNMIRDNRSQEEILDYLTNETIAVRDSLIADSTGIYGYINGEYMDGSGWQPEEGYDPTVRPWYVEAKAGNGKLVIVDPYIDLDTGTVMIAISKTLCDTKSVVGIDLSTVELQKIIEQHVAENRSSAECVINRRGQIIAHSDRDLVGAQFSVTSPFAAEISRRIQNTEDNYFYINFLKKDYMVYVMPLEDQWTCISIIDATNDFKKLNIPLIVTIVIALLMIIAMTFLMIQSDRKSREASEMALRSEKAVAASEAKSSFLSNMSHEIRTPINAIIGMNEMILRETEDHEIVSYAENIKKASGTLLGIINDILDFSKIEAGKIEILPVNYESAVLISDLVNMVKTRSEEKGLMLVLDFDRNLPRMLNGDEVRIKQVITNILSNAVKYTEKGSITFHISFQKAEFDPGHIFLDVSVKDTGIGIKQEDLEKLFVQFERIEEKRNRHVEGTGLGMTITKNLLGLMGSSLRVKSTYGEGSEFYFTLKQKVIDWEPMGYVGPAYVSHTHLSKKYREKFMAPDALALIIDDNPMNLAVFKSLIKQTLVSVDTANDGYEGMQCSRNIKYDIIFLDHMMPGLDGIETLKEMRADPNDKNRETPVISLTANAITGAREQYIEAGFDDYLTKPIDPDKLEEMLIRYLPEDKVQISASTAAEEQSKEAVHSGLQKLAGQNLVDVNTGIKNSGSVEAYLPILRIFNDSIEERAAELNSLYEQENWKDYTIKVHALKSSGRTIGAMALGIRAQKMEDAGKAENVGYIKAHHEKLIEEYLEIGELLKGVLTQPETNDSQKPMADEKLMLSVFEELEAAAELMDYGRLESVFTEMDEYRIPPSDEAWYVRIKEAGQQFDYQGLLDLLNERRGKDHET